MLSVKTIGAPDIYSSSLKNAIIDPEKVIAQPYQLRWTFQLSLVLYFLPFQDQMLRDLKAAIATETAANPTKLWKPATNSGIAVIGILNL